MLTEYDIVYVSRAAIKGQAVADYLAAQALPDYQPLQNHFPDEELLEIQHE